MSTPWRPLRVLVIDDSAMVRKLVQQKLPQGGRVEVVAAAGSGEAAIRDMVLTAPEVMLVDENLPGMTGSEFMRKVMARCPIPTVVFSGRMTDGLRQRARRDGAVDVVEKPSGLTDQDGFWRTLRETLLRAGQTKIRMLPANAAPPMVVGVAVSTGGPPVVRRVLRELPANLPPIVIVQHMRDAFVSAFANQLDNDSAMRVVLGRDGLPLMPGHCYVAPAGHQCFVVGENGRLQLKLGPGHPVSGHTPSGDALLNSIACTVGGRALGVVLTGMGADGAAGLLAMRRAGARTMAQDRDSSTVYGMPKAAAENGAARHIVALQSLSTVMTRECGVH